VSTGGSRPGNIGESEVGTVHLVYPHGPMTATPDAIGRNLGQRLETRYRVVYYDWTDRDEIHPEPGDVLLGHPHPARDTVFRRSSRLRGWRRVLMLSPFNGDPGQVAFLDSIIKRCDLYLAITGPYWLKWLGSSTFSHWAPKVVRLDLAISRQDFPVLRDRFNEPGRRRFVYIGHTGSTKNTPYLSEIAKRLPALDFAWIGPGDRPIEGVRALGRQDFRTQASRDLVSGFDFLLMVSKYDSNPTTILEAMSWGLIPICTPQCGYDDTPTILNVPLNDAETAARLLLDLETVPSDDLLEIQRGNWDLLDTHYTWDRFAAQVIDAIESPLSPPLGREGPVRRTRLVGSEWASPMGPVRSRTAATIRRLRHKVRPPT
jgi:glycosyltransferase involved in cell wall biosynthesis